MESDEDLSAMETSPTKDGSESFGDLSCITPDADGKEKNYSHEIDSDVSNQEFSISVSGGEDLCNPTSLLEVSDLLGLVSKNWFIFHVSPMWNLNFSTEYLNVICKQLNNILVKHIATNLKNSFSQISVDIVPKEAHHENIALKIEVNNTETNDQLYTGILLKSPKYNENYDKSNLSDMPVLMAQGNKSIVTAVHNWLTDHFDCVIRPYEFASYQFLWLIALSMGDAGQSYNETVLYHYLYQYELSKGQMDVKCYVESEFLRSILAKRSLNHSSIEATSVHYSDLLKVQYEIENHFKTKTGINVSKLKLIAFEVPKIASIKVSGKIQVCSSSLMDLILKYLMEQENNECLD